MKKIYLFESVIGSHIWGMDTPKSDVDIFRCYIGDSADILLGNKPENKNFMELNILDIQESELQTVIEQLIINNYNYLVYVFSPVTRWDSNGIKEKLKKYAERCLSKHCFDSIHGLALSNYKKYIESNKDNTERRCNIICRTLQFGITLLNEGKVEFKPFVGGNKDKILELLEKLDKAKNNSKLPDFSPDDVGREMFLWLLTLRKQML